MFETLVHRWLRIPYALNVGIDKGPKHPEQTIVFIHGLANSHAMWDRIIKKIDTKNTRVISVDLLGFGDSPKPTWQLYNATAHVRSLRRTLVNLRVNSPVIIVGHSLGTLVAIQYTTKYPRRVQQLLLCSPPFYKPSRLAAGAMVGPLKQPDDVYHILYRNSRYRKEIARNLVLFVKAARLTSKHFSVSDETMPAIVSSLEMSIENQTSLEDAKLLKVPIHVLYGQFDPFVIKSHIRELKTSGINVSTTVIPVAHEISGRIYEKAVLDTIAKIDKDMV